MFHHIQKHKFLELAPHQISLFEVWVVSSVLNYTAVQVYFEFLECFPWAVGKPPHHIKSIFVNTQAESLASEQS